MHQFTQGRSRLPRQSPIRKVLIYRLGSLGDTVVALPCFHLIARCFPEAERVLLTNFPVHSKAAASMAVLGDSGLVHGTMGYTVGTRRFGELLRLTREIWRFRPDLLVYLMPTRPWLHVLRDRIFFWNAGVRRIAGLPRRRALENRFDAATGIYESEAVRLERSIAELGQAHAEDLANWDLRLNAAEKTAAAQALAPMQDMRLLVCAPGCKMQANDWEQENWRALLGRLYRRYPSYGLVMAGGKEDADMCEYAALDWGGAKLNLAGRLVPRESAAAFARADVFIGPDSGPKHLASCMGVPCVCAFGARNLPGVWFPPGTRNQIMHHPPACFGCDLETCIAMEKKCIRSVTVEEMEQAVERVLGYIDIYSDKTYPSIEGYSAGLQPAEDW
jgi:ADP-heptose:LPS heptosyltransferase